MGVDHFFFLFVMPADNLPTHSAEEGTWSAEPRKLSKVEREKQAIDPWHHPANRQCQEPYHLKGVGFLDVNPSPPWTQPVKRFSVDETLLTHAAPKGFPPLPDVHYGIFLVIFLIFVGPISQVILPI